jgi:4-hydroxy-tetrahydrodipicolinate synthase
MLEKGTIDFSSLETLLNWQITEGCDGIVVCGSTGEAATLTVDEKKSLFAFVKNTVAERVPVITGSGTNCTQSSIELTRIAYEQGIRYSLLTCPYYNKPTQQGLFLHLTAIADALPDMQHILYNIPSRSVITIATETVIKLAAQKNIIGLKDSGSSIERVRLLRAACGPDFSLFSGDDDFAFACSTNGGDGVISVVANVLPAQMHAMIQAALANDLDCAKKLNELLMPFYSLLFCQSNPIPVKALLNHMHKIERGIRLPLTWLDEAYQAELFAAYLITVGATRRSPVTD